MTKWEDLYLKSTVSIYRSVQLGYCGLHDLHYEFEHEGLCCLSLSWSLRGKGIEYDVGIYVLTVYAFESFFMFSQLACFADNHSSNLAWRQDNFENITHHYLVWVMQVIHISICFKNCNSRWLLRFTVRVDAHFAAIKLSLHRILPWVLHSPTGCLGDF